MKTFLSIFALLLIVSCSSSTGNEDEFEPYRIGSFLMTSETTAEFVGTPSKIFSADPDTLIITGPDGTSLVIEQDTTETSSAGTAEMVFIDSTYPGSAIIDGFTIAMNSPEGNFYPRVEERAWTIGEDAITIESRIIASCGFTKNPFEDVIIDYMSADTVHSVVVIKALGIAEVMEGFQDC